MIPAQFVRLYELPLSPSGKIDFGLLAVPTPENLLADDIVVPAADAKPIEEKLLRMMRQVLRNNAVRPNDNFFLAGGHSLLAMQLLMRVRDVFGIEMTLRRLFEAPTVASLALLVERTLIENIHSMTEEEAERQLTE